MTDETETTEAEVETETVETTEPENISDLFDEDAETTEESTTETEGAAAEKGETETEGEKEAETAEAEKPEETETETPSEEEGSVPRKALLEERRKRQEAEGRLRELEPADEEAPDPTDDPEGHEKYLRAKWERERWEKVATQSRDRMLEKQPDYEEKEKHFLFLASQDADLVKQMNEDPDPAAFAYNKAKESLDAQEKAIEDRVVERLRKEGKLKEESKTDESVETAARVSDLTSATGAGKNTGEEEIKESSDPEDVFDDLAY